MIMIVGIDTDVMIIISALVQKAFFFYLKFFIFSRFLISDSLMFFIWLNLVRFTIRLSL